MKVVQFEEVETVRRSPRGREGSLEVKMLLTGDEDRADNFSFRWTDTDDNIYSPRHHHNFEQFTYLLDGETDFGNGMVLKAGQLIYIPEGTYYGPLSMPAHRRLAVQFGGPSGSGYLSQEGTTRAHRELQETGEFKKGVYHPNDDAGGKGSQDSYEAIWEHVRQRTIVYPEPQYGGPIIIAPENFPWEPVGGMDGVHEKALGTFSSARTRAAKYRLESGTKFVAAGRGLFVVLSGEGRVEDQGYAELTTVYLDDGEEATFLAGDETEIVLLGLPSLARIADEPPQLRVSV